MSTAAQTSAAHCGVYSRLSCRWTVWLKSNQCYTHIKSNQIKSHLFVSV